MSRSSHSDGHASTASMLPCRCGCGAELVIACPKGCANAELGLHAEMDPIAKVRPPTKPDTPPRARLAFSVVPRRLQKPAPWICGRCLLEIPRRHTSGRAPNYHESCLTEQERRNRASKQKHTDRMKLEARTAGNGETK